MTTIETANESDIASTTYMSLVAQYRTFAKETAENIVRLAETLVEAKKRLSANPNSVSFAWKLGLNMKVRLSENC